MATWPPNSFRFILGRPSSARLSLPISTHTHCCHTEGVLCWKMRNSTTLTSLLLFSVFKGGKGLKLQHSSIMNMEFILLRGSPEGFIQFLSTPACWFKLFSRQTQSFFPHPFLHLRWPSADPPLLLMQINKKYMVCSVLLSNTSTVAAWGVYRCFNWFFSFSLVGGGGYSIDKAIWCDCFVLAVYLHSLSYAVH